MIVDSVLAILSVASLVAGCAIATIGLIGLILKPDLFDQLHVAGLVTGPGVLLVLLASVGTRSPETVTSALLVMGFVLVTSSISTHVIAQAGLRRYRPAVDQNAAGATGPVIDRETRSPGAGPLDADVLPPLEGGMRVVLAYDGSPAAQVGADLTASIDWPDRTVIKVVRAVSGELRAIDPTAARDAAGHPAPVATASADLDGVAASLRRSTIQVETSLLAGDPADVIIDEASAFGAHLLITGNRRRGRIQSLLGWSAAGEIVDRAPYPVLVARSTTLRAVMLTTDGSAQSERAAELVARWPIFDLTRIHVVAVAPDPEPALDDPGATSRSGADHRRAVDIAAARLMDAGRDVVTDVLRGRPGPRIVEAAARNGVDLIVIGSRGRTGLGRSLLGSVAGDVLASASCSVLVVGPPLRRSPLDPS